MDEQRVDLLGTIRVIHEHLTGALCESVFAKMREGERRRVWTLEAMAMFWTSVILRAPESLRQALDEASVGGGGYPRAVSSKQAFFQRAKGMRWQFFRGLLEDFSRSVLEGCKPAYERALREKLPSFPEVWIVDGSRLDQIAHRLKVLWKQDAAVLPGSVLALYDVFRGIARRVEFCEDAAAAEVPSLRELLDAIPQGTILLGDSAYCSHRLFGALSERGICALVRSTESISVEKVEVLSRVRDGNEVVEDTIVLIGTAQRPRERQKVRLIEKQRHGAKTLRLLTSMLEPDKLPAATALALYEKRWTVERLFYDLKEVIDLHSFYAGNANAVAMQVYAAVLVHTAMRVAQAGIAAQLELEPERLSVEKLFPRVAAASSALITSQLAFIAVSLANPGVSLVEPVWEKQPFAFAPLKSLLVETRDRPRRVRRRAGRIRSAHPSLHRFTQQRHSRLRR